MLNINLIRENPEVVEEGVRKKGYDAGLVDKVLEADMARRELIVKVDDSRKERNEVAGAEQRTKDIEQRGREIKEELKTLEPQLKELEEQFENALGQIPNLPSDKAPTGAGEEDNKEVSVWGEPDKTKSKDHLEIGKTLGIIDFERGVKVGGFRGYYLKNEGARLHWAVLQFAFDHLIQKGFSPVVPPVINRRFALLGGGQFPWGEEDTYKVGEEDFLVGTAEIPLMAMHSDETFDLKDLPKKYVGMSACFRTEIGSYGKDTKGLYRVHEFYKVEQVILCEADEQESLGFFEDLQDNSEDILQKLSLPYQVVILSSQDMGKKAALTYDIETWMPGRGSYGETHSNSIVLDFQTRRLKIKYRGKDGQVKFCHALNNTAIASPRILIAILENFQQEDGSVKIPEVLQKYTGFSEIRPK